MNLHFGGSLCFSFELESKTSSSTAVVIAEIGLSGIAVAGRGSSEVEEVLRALPPAFSRYCLDIISIIDLCGLSNS